MVTETDFEKFENHIGLLALACPKSNTSIREWCPFGGDPLHKIINDYNKKCINCYEGDQSWLPEDIKTYAEVIFIEPYDLTDAEKLEEDRYIHIRILLVDLDSIKEKQSILRKIKTRMDRVKQKYYLIQISQTSNTKSCKEYFDNLPIFCSDILTNQTAFKNELYKFCEVYRFSSKNMIELVSDTISPAERKAISRTAGEVRDEAIRGKLSKEDTEKLAIKEFTATLISNTVDSTTKKRIRKLKGYDSKQHPASIPISQRQLTPYTISGTDIVCHGDDQHFINAPIQQEWDDIRRTCIVGLDLAHETLKNRLGKEVTPETINYYLEVLNHEMPGAAIVQEHMIEKHPALVDDCYVKIFTGDETLQDEVDKQYVINIDNEFPDYQAKQVKAAIGKTTWQAVHIPTIVSRTKDGPSTSRWIAMQVGRTLISAYHMCAGEEAVGELLSTVKNVELIEMGDMIPARRAKGPYEPGRLSFSHMADVVQASRKTPDDPCNVVLQTATAATMLYDHIWLGGYMSGGVGFTMYATPAYTNDIIDDFLYWGADYAQKKYGSFGNAKATIDTVKDIATETTLYGLEQYEKYPTTLEDHFGDSQRATVLAIAAGGATALATGHSNAGLSAWYLSMYLHKEACGRLGFYGYDLQDQCGAIGSDESTIGNVRDSKYPYYKMNLGHQGGYTAVISAAHASRKDAFCLNPLVKTCFADESINFDFEDPRAAFGKAALREWDRCAGERTFIIPGK